MSLGYCHGQKHESTYYSPNIMFINVVHKYNRGLVRNTIKDTRHAAYFIRRGSAII